MWIDAKVVLDWLSQYNAKETYIHNRIKQVRELVSKDMKIMYIPTKENPADLITRGQDAEKMLSQTLWTEGPEFLKKSEEEWPVQDREWNLFPEGCEEKVSVFKFGGVGDLA